MIFEKNVSFKINSSGKFYCRWDWVWDLRHRPFYDFDLWFLVEGKGSLDLDGKKFDLEGGDCFLMRPGMRLYADNDHDNPLVAVFAHFDMFDANGCKLNINEEEIPALYRKIADPFFFSGILHRMLDAFYRNDNCSAVSWLKAALTEMCNIDNKDNFKINDYNHISEYIRELCSKINEHPDRDYKLEKLAYDIGYSSQHFSRLFKKYAGVSFREFFITARINRAKYLLSSTEYSISQVAEISGYDDIFLFSKLFKKHTGIPPSQYRNASR